MVQDLYSQVSALVAHSADAEQRQAAQETAVRSGSGGAQMEGGDGRRGVRRHHQ